MISSGWILPDLYEVKCFSSSNYNGHVEIVKRYLENLKTKDCTTYDKIAYRLYQVTMDKSPVALDDFAVTCLGWIKINNNPINILFYTEESDLEFLVQRYINIGYLTVSLKNKSPPIQVDVPSKELI